MLGFSTLSLGVEERGDFAAMWHWDSQVPGPCQDEFTGKFAVLGVLPVRKIFTKLILLWGEWYRPRQISQVVTIANSS